MVLSVWLLVYLRRQSHQILNFLLGAREVYPYVWYFLSDFGLFKGIVSPDILYFLSGSRKLNLYGTFRMAFGLFKGTVSPDILFSLRF
jgi:hypothetical protein